MTRVGKVRVRNRTSEDLNIEVAPGQGYPISKMLFNMMLKLIIINSYANIKRYILFKRQQVIEYINGVAVIARGEREL